MREREVKSMSDYERYLIIASYEIVLAGGYQGYIGMRDVIEVMQLMTQKQQTTYLYNEEFKTSPLTIIEMNTILECWRDGKHRMGFNKLKLLANQMGVRNI